MKEIDENSRTWSGTRNMKDFEISSEIREEKKNRSQQKHSKRIKSCLNYLLVAAATAIALILIFIILDRNGRNPVLVYFQGIFPSKTGEEGEFFRSNLQEVADTHSFMEKGVNSRYHNSSGSSDQLGLKSDSGHYQSVLELYMNRLFVTPLNKMSLTIPVNDQILRSYQVEAIDYSIDDEMVLYLSLEHQLKINNETMVLYDKSMNVISHFPTYGDERDTEKDVNQNANITNNQNNSTENKLRNNENKRRLQQLKQHEYYNYTSTSEWNHKPEIVNNIIPTYYPRNPYVPPYGNPYYFAPNILVPYVYIY
ncbi:uncharacterized protein cubi_03735 [Cryptosporidium ubiquitum]|uniref:Transmembrane protein n=1 Tax=Cryptosporidium ubiquitum TaxID=857276 RepID=A0A1J4MM31_9CRYT|nr:uncharacterized protein cubi_03735 [Cryptosporidium ubiquitum]OII75256.1 hypothetical protein cubi_03735 [Cryptosporidium ubiquitum]